MKDYIVLAGHVCDSIEDRRSLSVTTRIATDKQHVDRPFPACRIRLEFRIVGGREVGRAVSELLQAGKRRWEITDHQVVAGKRHVLVWYRVPSDDALDATGQAFNEIARPARGIQVVEDIRTMLFDLRPQDVRKRCSRTQAAFARPQPLNVLIISNGVKRPFGPLVDGEQDMRSG